jgi:hypothetical protein
MRLAADRTEMCSERGWTISVPRNGRGGPWYHVVSETGTLEEAEESPNVAPAGSPAELENLDLKYAHGRCSSPATFASSLLLALCPGRRAL